MFIPPHKQSIFWTAYCTMERILGTSEIEKICSRYGYISDFKQFSDIAIAFSIEVPEAKRDALYKDLGSILSLDPYEAESKAAETEVHIMLNVTFTHGSGNLKIEVPAVPG